MLLVRVGCLWYHDLHKTTCSVVSSIHAMDLASSFYDQLYNKRSIYKNKYSKCFTALVHNTTIFRSLKACSLDFFQFVQMFLWDYRTHSTYSEKQKQIYRKRTHVAKILKYDYLSSTCHSKKDNSHSKVILSLRNARDTLSHKHKNDNASIEQNLLIFY